MKNWKIILIVIGFIIAMIGIGFGMGYLDVGYTKTVGVAKQNAQREVYEETNSFTRGKRQEAIKLYKEWKSAESIEDKKAIETVVSMDFADFDEDKYITNPKLLNWIKKCKY